MQECDLNYMVGSEVWDSIDVVDSDDRDDIDTTADDTNESDDDGEAVTDTDERDIDSHKWYKLHSYITHTYLRYKLF